MWKKFKYIKEGKRFMNISKDTWKKISSILKKYKIQYTSHWENEDKHIQINLVIPNYSKAVDTSDVIPYRENPAIGLGAPGSVSGLYVYQCSECGNIIESINPDYIGKNYICGKCKYKKEITKSSETKA